MLDNVLWSYPLNKDFVCKSENKTSKYPENNVSYLWKFNVLFEILFE